MRESLNRLKTEPMYQQLQRNFDVIQYLVKNASPEQLTWRKDQGSRSLADVLIHLRDIERWNALLGNTGYRGEQRFSGNYPADAQRIFDSYACYRRQTMRLLAQQSSLTPCTVTHRLFGEMPLDKMVEIMAEYDQIHIHQLEDVIKEMPSNPLLTRALYEISDYHERYRAHLAQASTLLDIGVGSGLALRHVMQQNPHLTPTGIDIRDLRLPEVKVPLQIYNGQTIPFEANSFDVALIFYVLHHCQDPQRVLQEAVRVTRDKLIIIEEFDRPGSDETSLDLTERESHRALGIPPDLYYQLFDQVGFEQMLQAHGLVQLDRQRLPSQTTRPVEKYLYVLHIEA